jgi:DNA mismatch repair protein MutL
LNSLDAKATAVAIRVNLATFRIQVVDNGRGISRANLESVGLRYMTTKCHSLSDFKKRIKFYGFKGEALASVSNVSRRVCITTREHECEDTYEKTIEKDESTVEVTKMRPSGGTTVTVEGFLSNLPVRQQCIKNNEFESIRRSVESLVIIHPRVSFTLRNELGGKVLLASVKCPDIASSFKTIHPNVDENEFDFFRVTKSETSVEGLIHKELGENKRLQYIYVNKRPINCPKIQQLINSHFKNAKTRGNDRKKTSPIFVMHIKCPYSDVDISLESTKTVVFFKKFDIVKQCVDKMMNAVLGKGDVEFVEKKPRKEMSEFGVSQIGGAVKGVGTKRKSTMLEEIAPSKSPKIVDDTPCYEKPREVTKQTKRALPIEIRKSDKKEEVCESRWDFGGVGDNTLCTNFPENEQKGKDVIMDMFMMSLSVFPEENKRPESLDQNGDGFEIPNKVTMGVQTTLDEPPTRENMISVGVQAGPSNIQIVDSNFTFFPRRPFKTYVSDYDFDFSKVDAFPRFDKQYKNDLGVFNCFEQTRKLFDFRNHHPGPVDAFPDYNQDSFSYLRDSFFGGNDVLEDERVDSVIPTIHFEKPLPRKKVALRGVELVQRSPYFLKKFLAKQVKERSNEGREMNCGCQNEPEMGSRDGLEDTASYCSHKDQGKNILGSKNLQQVEMTFVRREEGKVNLDETTISKYFSPRRIERGKKINFPLRIGGKTSNLQSLDESRDLFNYLSQNRYEGKVKERIVNKDLECEKQTGQEIISPTLTQPQMDWIEKVDKSGANNLRLASPKKDMTFEITERFDFVPKGLSPILKDFGKVAVLSPESREHLQNAVIQSYDDELLVVKWQNYITTKGN